MAGDCTDSCFTGVKSCIMVLLWWTAAGHPRLWQMQVLVEVAGAGSWLTPSLLRALSPLEALTLMPSCRLTTVARVLGWRRTAWGTALL